jgi:LysR family transcriptional regulator, low CO2-responsive transcriptional regulator
MQPPNSSLPDIDFRYLRTFLALARFGNFSETGRQVGLSQPAVSRQVRAVEDALGVRLFERLGRRAVLTSAGQALRTRLETLMREADSLPRLIRDLAEGVHGDVRIGATITAANAILPSLLGEYRRSYPSVELALQPGSSARVLEVLTRGEIDLALVGSDTLPASVTVLAEIPDAVLLIAARDHRFAGRRVKPADLEGCEFIQREPASDTRTLVSRWLQTEGVHVRNVMDVW